MNSADSQSRSMYKVNQNSEIQIFYAAILFKKKTIFFLNSGRKISLKSTICLFLPVTVLLSNFLFALF